MINLAQIVFYIYKYDFKIHLQYRYNMPLDKSGSKKSIGKNIKTEMEVGKPKKQAIAIALNTAREHGAKIPMKKKK